MHDAVSRVRRVRDDLPIGIFTLVGAVSETPPAVVSAVVVVPLALPPPVVESLAKTQFDDYVKRVRIFVHPRLVEPILGLDDFESCVLDAVGEAAG